MKGRFTVLGAIDVSRFKKEARPRPPSRPKSTCPLERAAAYRPFQELPPYQSMAMGEPAEPVAPVIGTGLKM